MNTEEIERGLIELLQPEAPDGAPCSALFYRYVSGDMTEEETTDFKAHLADCQLCNKELVGLVPLVRSEATIQRPKRRLAIIATALAAMIAMAFAWIQFSNPKDTSKAPNNQFVPKSGYDLQIAVQRQGQRFTATRGQPFNPGDLIGFFYTAPRETWPALYFGTASLEIERIFPPSTPFRMPAGAELPLPVSAIVEKGDECEWIIAVFSEDKPDYKQLESIVGEALRRADTECTLGELGIPEAAVVIWPLLKEDQ